MQANLTIKGFLCIMNILKDQKSLLNEPSLLKKKLKFNENYFKNLTLLLHQNFQTTKKQTYFLGLTPGGGLLLLLEVVVPKYANVAKATSTKVLVVEVFNPLTTNSIGRSITLPLNNFIDPL